MFEVVERKPGENYWEFRLTDAIVGDRPLFRHPVPKSGLKFTVQELANAAAGQLNEATGMIVASEFIDGIPSAVFVFASNGRQVTCVRSSDPQRCPAPDPATLIARGEAWLRSRQRGEPCWLTHSGNRKAWAYFDTLEPAERPYAVAAWGVQIGKNRRDVLDAPGLESVPYRKRVEIKRALRRMAKQSA